jgi:hypothetical protein
MSLLLKATLANGAAVQCDCLQARSFTVSCRIREVSALAYFGDDGQTKIAEVFVEASWAALQKLRNSR